MGKGRVILIGVATLCLILVAIDVFFQQKIIEDIEVELFQDGYRQILTEDTYREHAYYHSFLWYIYSIKCRFSKEQEQNLIGMTMDLEFYLARQKQEKSGKESSFVTIHETWETCYLSYYLLSAEERKKVYAYLEERGV